MADALSDLKAQARLLHRAALDKAKTALRKRFGKAAS